MRLEVLEMAHDAELSLLEEGSAELSDTSLPISLEKSFTRFLKSSRVSFLKWYSGTHMT